MRGGGARQDPRALNLGGSEGFRGGSELLQARGAGRPQPRPSETSGPLPRARRPALGSGPRPPRLELSVRRVTMKVVNLKQAILQAWKERWSDYQWAINMKRFFPRGATWDILNLAGLGGGEGFSLLTGHTGLFWGSLLVYLGVSLSVPRFGALWGSLLHFAAPLSFPQIPIPSHVSPFPTVPPVLGSFPPFSPWESSGISTA